MVDLLLDWGGVIKTYMERRNKNYTSMHHPPIENWYYIHPPNIDYCLCNQEYQFHRKANSEGLSDREFNTNQGDSAIKILALGDSFTEGDGTDADSTYLKTTERILICDNPKLKFEFYNAGVCGSDLVFEYQLLKDKLLKYKPNIVIVALNNSDLMEDIPLRGGFERFSNDGTTRYTQAPWWEFFYAESYVFRLVASVIFRYDLLLMTPQSKEKQLPGTLKVVKQAVESFDRLSKKNGFKFILMIHPYKEEWIQGAYYNKLRETIDTLSHMENIDTYDAMRYYNDIAKIEKNTIPEYYWKKDGHHNSKGYNLMGKAAAYKVQQILNSNSFTYSITKH